MNTPGYFNNPYYTGGYPNIQPPQMTYPSNNTPRSIIAGRSVNSINDITPGEVPFDGSVSVFPKNDGTAIYVKSYNGDGTIDTRYYIPAPEGYSEETSNSDAPAISLDDILQSVTNLTNQVDDMKSVLDGLSKNSSSNKQYNHNKNNGNQQNKKGSDVNVA